MMLSRSGSLSATTTWSGLAPLHPKHEAARVRLIVRVAFNRLTSYQDVMNIRLADVSLEHGFYRMNPEHQPLRAVHLAYPALMAFRKSALHLTLASLSSSSSMASVGES